MANDNCSMALKLGHIIPTCIKMVLDNPKCPKCRLTSIKKGKRNGVQRYRCAGCGRCFQRNYVYSGCCEATRKLLIQLVCEGSSFRSISRVLGVSPTTVASQVLVAAERACKPMVPLGKTYQMDELCTFIGAKTNRYWVAYAVRTDTKQVVDFRVGKRSNRTLRPVIDTMILARAKQIRTDRLKQYRYLIPADIHKVKQFGINHIERKNLTLRTDLKRLSRRTICFSRSLRMLEACLRVYFYRDHRPSSPIAKPHPALL